MKRSQMNIAENELSPKGAAIAKNRNVQFDLLRICAAVMVVMIHVISPVWNTLTPVSEEWIALNIYDCFIRSAVALFFMLNGAFMLKKDISLKNLYLKKIIPLCIIYLLWSFLYAIDICGLDTIIELIQTSQFTVMAKELIAQTIRSTNHLWFMPTLIGTYMLQPILRGVVTYKNGVYIRYFIMLFIVFGVIIPTITLFISNEVLLLLLSKIPMELVGYSGYVIIGYYLANIQKRKVNPYIMLLGVLLTAGISAIICQIDAVNKGVPSNILYGYFTIPTFLQAVFLFLIAKNVTLNVSEKTKAAVYSLSSLTLGVYLFHPFVITQMKKIFNLSVLSYNTFISVPSNTVLIACISFLVTAIMCKIPVVKKLWKF